jgi:formate hydrogenlyase subunit 3/multisubunit Na+/H+ antiporter MnhD subunit
MSLAPTSRNRLWGFAMNSSFRACLWGVLCLALAAAFLGGSTPVAFGEALRVDALSALVVVLCGFVSLLTGIYTVGYVRRNEARGLVTARIRREFFGLIPAYVFALLFVAT